MDETTAAQRWARDDVSSHAPPPTATRRRRTLGVCAHCHEAVDFTDEYVRLYRRAWHLECALASEPQPRAQNAEPSHL